MDRRTDGQNYDSQDRLAYARAVKMNFFDKMKDVTIVDMFK